MQFIYILLTGIFAAALHVITGPDHLAAVSPLVIETKKRAWKIGLYWGMGHLFGMLSIGLLFLFFKEQIPLEEISEYSEQLVGLVLIGIGIWALYRIYKKPATHKHTHIHNDENPYIHRHQHKHNISDISHDHPHNKKVKHNDFSAFTVGILHGFAGIAHLILFLPVFSFSKHGESVSYIIGFGAGTILAMVLYAFLIGRLSSLTRKSHNSSFFNIARLIGGISAILIGIFWLIT